MNLHWHESVNRRFPSLLTSCERDPTRSLQQMDSEETSIVEFSAREQCWMFGSAAMMYSKRAVTMLSRFGYDDKRCIEPNMYVCGIFGGGNTHSALASG